MDEPLQWISETYRGTRIDALAFEVVDGGSEGAERAAKWGYVVAIRAVEDGEAEMEYGPPSGRSAYRSREEAVHAALTFARAAIDVIRDLG